MILIIKMRVVGRGGRQVHKLHESKQVCAGVCSVFYDAGNSGTSYRRRTCAYIEGEGIQEAFQLQKISRSPIIEERQGLRR